MFDGNSLLTSPELLKKLATYGLDLKEQSESYIEDFLREILSKEPGELGKRIRAVRAKLKLKQQDLADRVPCAQVTLSLIELGKRIASVDLFKRICVCLKVDPSELIVAAKSPNQGCSVVVLGSDDFYGKEFSQFTSFLTELKQRENDPEIQQQYQRIEVPGGVLCDFAVKVTEGGIASDSGKLNGICLPIVTGAQLLCSTAPLLYAKKYTSEYFDYLNSKLVIMSVHRGPALLRKVVCDNFFVRFIPWNDDLPYYEFSRGNVSEKFKSVEQANIVNGYEASLSDVSVFGIVTKIVIDPAVVGCAVNFTPKARERGPFSIIPY